MSKAKRQPVIGCAFDPDFRDDAGRVSAYLDELRYYRPRGYGKLAKEGDSYLKRIEADDQTLETAHWYEWMGDVDQMLTEWARRVLRHDYISYGPFPHGGAVGFYVSVDAFLDDCDLKVDDLGEVEKVMGKGFSGLIAQVSDHGNVTGFSYSRGRARELFAVV